MSTRTKPAPEKNAAEPAATEAQAATEAPSVIEEQPATGGSFVRNGDGSLTCVSPPPRDEGEAEADTPPAEGGAVQTAEPTETSEKQD